MLNGGYGYAYPAMRKSRPHPPDAPPRNSPPRPPTESPINSHPSPIQKLYTRELPDSQESYVSTASSTYAAPSVYAASSNISNSTAADTNLTSPPSSNLPLSQLKSLERAIPPSPIQLDSRHAQSPVPRIDAAPAMRTGDTAAGPMVPDSPISQGFKRTADGTLKSAALTVHSSAQPWTGHKRNKSMGAEASSRPRIGELSAQLRTRLSYAMVKVQNGWEKQSLEELEDLPSQRGSPRSEGSRPTFESPRPVERGRRPSGMSEDSDQMMMSPGRPSPADMSNSLGSTPQSFWRFIPKANMDASINLMTVTGTSPGMLAPAADISSRRKRRSSASHPPPPLLSSTHRKHYSDLGALAGAPRTPTAVPRAGILRMPSQQAEKDAVDTLLFMSSPNNSGRLPHTNMEAAHPSPLRSEMPRRVMFDEHPTKSKMMPSPQQRLAPNGQHTAYYRADPARQ